jgi:hypothetical protein
MERSHRGQGRMRRHAPSKEYYSCTVQMTRVNTSHKTSHMMETRMVAEITLLETLQLFTHCRYASIVFQWLPLRQQQRRKHRQLETPQPRRQEMWAPSSKPPMAREEPIAFIFKTLLAQVSTNVILKCGKCSFLSRKWQSPGLIALGFAESKANSRLPLCGSETDTLDVMVCT